MGNRVGEAIRRVRRQRRLTQAEIALKVGVAAPYLSMLESGDRKGALEVIQRLEHALGLPQWQLEDVWREEMGIASRPDKPIPKMPPIGDGIGSSQEPSIKVVPASCVRGFLQKPSPQIAHLPLQGQIAHHRIPDEVFSFTNFVDEATMASPSFYSDCAVFAIVVDDDAMSPNIERGDRVVVDTTEEPRDGDLVAVYRGQTATVRRLTGRGSKAILDAYDREVLPENFNPNKQREEIVGVVTSVYRQLRRPAPKVELNDPREAEE